MVRKPYEVLRLDYMPGVPFIETPLVNPLPLPPILTTLPASPDINQRSVDATITVQLIVWLNGIVTSGVEGQIQRNDGLINTIQTLSGCTSFGRNVHHDSVSGLNRADHTIAYRNVALVIIEEKDYDMRDCEIDLNKIVWTPHNWRVPFVFGLCFTKTHLKIFTIPSNLQRAEIFFSPLTTHAHRLVCIRAAVNVARILKGFIEDDLMMP